MSVLLSTRQIMMGQLNPRTHSSRLLPKFSRMVSSKVLEQEALRKNERKNSDLPKLIVPPLKDTLGKYLRSVRPLLTNEEFDRTATVVKDFEGGIGSKLQKLLEERASKTDNWLADWWLNGAYLEYRWPVVVHSSPGIVFLQNYKSTTEQLLCAAKIIYAALEYKTSIDNKTIKTDMMGKFPLDMSQYKKLFGTNRKPGRTKDELFFYPNSRHIIVAYKNYFYRVDVIDENGAPMNINEIHRQLKFVVESTSGLSGVPVGILSSENRNTWGQIYEKFTKDSLNAASLKEIEESLFLVAIDRPNRPYEKTPIPTLGQDVEDVKKSEIQNVGALQMLCGNKTNSGNRWFDKTVQFIVGSDGECGMTYEHSPAEGPPIAAVMDYILGNFSRIDSLLENDTNSPPSFSPRELHFNINDKMAQTISEAKDSLDLLTDDLHLACFSFLKYGKDFIKTFKLSPDSFIQMAIQSAFFRMYGIPAAHYESASTRMFIGGRTETIRSCSIESLEFAKNLIDSKVSAQDKFKLMKKAVDGHKNYAANAVQGLGVDRHLLGLKKCALEAGMDLPELFLDFAFTHSTNFRVSTSQVPSPNDAFMCFGPVVSDGYGCCYNPLPNQINFGISAFNSSPDTNADEFKLALQQTLLDMQKVALQALPSKL